MTPNSGRRRAQRLFPAERCEMCGTTENLERHHRNHDTSDNLPENIQILCRKHHYEVHPTRRGNGGRFARAAAA